MDATTMQLVLMVTDHTHVNVKMDSLEMDSLAQVIVAHGERPQRNIFN